MPRVNNIRVDYERCNRQGKCIDACTQLVWKWKRKGLKKAPVPKHPERCIVCEKCRDVCSENAIEIELEE